ncbi:MAG TPA: HDOD domain-containing protein [Burkholderiaceae bacterium]|nr:HDOD domain-containing protein [Burkholderiaceae bacterium]
MAGLPQAAAPQASEAGASEFALDLELRFFDWLLGETLLAGAGTAEEAQLLAHVDLVSRSEEMRKDLLPRARSVIPELLHSLRDDNQSIRALSARVAHDPNLVVEVIRMANTMGYRADSPVADLMQAVSRLGTEGLRRAIARVLLKPIFDAQADPLLARATQRLWQHSELTASLCLQQAPGAGLDPFESYLAGLVHNVGWTAVLRTIDRNPGGTPQRFSGAFVQALAPRRERLFALFVRSWELSSTLTSLAQEVIDVGFVDAHQPMAQLLRFADRTACQQLLEPPDGSSPSTDSAAV